MKKDFKVAVIQAHVPKSTLEGEQQVDRLVKEATSEPVDIVGLPEDCLAKFEDIKNDYDPLCYLSGIAKKYNVYLFGATLVKEGGDLYNRGFFFDREGNLINTHDKVVLTPPEVEDGLKPNTVLKIGNSYFRD